MFLTMIRLVWQVLFVWMKALSNFYLKEPPRAKSNYKWNRLFRKSPSILLNETESLKVHAFEVWICCVLLTNTNLKCKSLHFYLVNIFQTCWRKKKNMKYGKIATAPNHDSNQIIWGTSFLIYEIQFMVIRLLVDASVQHYRIVYWLLFVMVNVYYEVLLRLKMQDAMRNKHAIGSSF